MIHLNVGGLLESSARRFRHLVLTLEMLEVLFGCMETISELLYHLVKQ